MAEPGRPTDYKEEYNDQAYKLCLLGAIDTQLADFFGVCEKTINTWKKDRPGFLQSINKGKIIADAEIAEALYHRAKGYEHPAVHILRNTVKKFDEKGKLSSEETEPLIVDIVKHYPPDTAAAFIWLKNRSKFGGEKQLEWKDKQETKTTIDVDESFKKLLSLLPKEAITKIKDKVMDKIGL